MKWRQIQLFQYFHVVFRFPGQATSNWIIFLSHQITKDTSANATYFPYTKFYLKKPSLIPENNFDKKTKKISQLLKKFYFQEPTRPQKKM